MGGNVWPGMADDACVSVIIREAVPCRFQAIALFRNRLVSGTPRNCALGNQERRGCCLAELDVGYDSLQPRLQTVAAAHFVAARAGDHLAPFGVKEIMIDEFPQ